MLLWSEVTEGVSVLLLHSLVSPKEFQMSISSSSTVCILEGTAVVCLLLSPSCFILSSMLESRILPYLPTENRSSDNLKGLPSPISAPLTVRYSALLGFHFILLHFLDPSVTIYFTWIFWLQDSCYHVMEVSHRLWSTTNYGYWAILGIWRNRKWDSIISLPDDLALDFNKKQAEFSNFILIYSFTTLPLMLIANLQLRPSILP